MKVVCVALACLLVGCGGAPALESDAGVMRELGDSGSPSVDAGVNDAGSMVDAGEFDAGVVDAGVVDAGVVDAGVVDAGVVDAGVVDAGVVDAGVADAGVADAGLPDAGASGHPGWAKALIPAGSHPAIVTRNGAPRLPLSGLVSVPSRTWDFIFDASAMYRITNPVQPGDQLDWNKLPGLSDCGQLDLAQDGFMFAWRWRLDLTPNVLELAHYANNAGVHLSPAQGLVTLDEADLRAESPLRYELSIGGPNGSRYLFRISGTIRGRVIDVQAEHPRRCVGSSQTALKWAGGFYFGGTSTAPQTITGWLLE